jgi:hypothetical protein
MGNPLYVAMRREAQSCKGCRHIENMFGRDFCNNPKVNTTELRRCSKYELKGVEDAGSHKQDTIV